jgi:hypothetical protein
MHADLRRRIGGDVQVAAIHLAQLAQQIAEGSVHAPGPEEIFDF